MIKTQKSQAEIEIHDEITKMIGLVDRSSITVTDAMFIIAKAAKVQVKCEELRKSRDNWRNRAEVAESKLKKLQ